MERSIDFSNEWAPTISSESGRTKGGGGRNRCSGFRVFRHIRIDADGIYDSRIGGMIDWSEIQLIADRSIHGYRIIEFGLTDPDRVLDRPGGVHRALARLNRRFGFAHYGIAIERFGPRRTAAEVSAALLFCR